MRNIHFANVPNSEYYPELALGMISLAFALVTRVNPSHPVHYPGPEHYPGPHITIPQERDVNRRRYYRRSLGERTPLIELITVCYCIVAYVRRLNCDTPP